MRRSDFHYPLPAHLIAQRPLAQRSASRLLHVDGPCWFDRRFSDLPELLREGDLLVVNDTRVLTARLFGRKDSGGRVEVLIERVLDAHQAWAHVRASKAPRPGGRLILEGGVEVDVLEREESLFRLRFVGDQSVNQVLDSWGHVPLPPYIERADSSDDRERYQTVYAARPGAVAAPTAGLHFDDDLLAACARRGVEQAFITLHVGAGTFQPMRADAVKDHRMHAEWMQVRPEVCVAIERTRARGGRVVAVGTTVMRALESAVDEAGAPVPYDGQTDIFITPGYRFRVVDALVTNFHLPESTLLMLVCAFGGYDTVMSAYGHAVAKAYRFFSYGDAMLLTPEGRRP